MPRLDVQIPAPDGRSHGTPHVPEGDGPWPGVLMFPGVGHAVEIYPARHGFAVPDNPTYDAAADARRWAALRQLYQGRLR
jgi:dienelactone hydrolase